MYSENDFWIPTFKHEYVQWLEKNYPKNKQGQKINWNFFPLKRLKAIYIGIRKDYENANASSSQSVGIRQKQVKNCPIHANETRENPSRNSMVQSQAAQICFDFSS